MYRTYEGVTIFPLPSFAANKRQGNTWGQQYDHLTRSQLVQGTWNDVSPAHQALSKSAAGVVHGWSVGVTSSLCGSGQSSGCSGRSTVMKIQLCPFSLQLPDLVLCKSKPLSKNFTVPHPLSYLFFLILPFHRHLGVLFIILFCEVFCSNVLNTNL